MIGIQWLQRLAEAVPSELGMAGLLLAVTVAAAAVAWRNDPARLRRNAPGLAYLALSSVLLLAAPRVLLPWPAVAALLVCSLLLLIFQRNRDTPDLAEPVSTTGPLVVGPYLAAGAGLAGLLLLADLTGYAGSILVWEYEVSAGFEAALRAEQSFSSYTLQQLLWDSGLVSTGDHSLMYGSTTYALWRVAGASIFTLRIMAAVLALACLLAAWLAGRSAGDRSVAAAAVILFAVNPALIFYGRYGTSLSGSIFAVLLAFCACSLLVHPDRGRWWAGPLAGGALVLATFGYSPGRLAVIGMLAAIALVAAVDWRRIDRQRLAGFVLLLVVLGSVWAVQHRFDTTRFFVSARGEQVVAALSYPDGIRAYLGREVPPDRLSWPDRAQIVGAILETTVPQSLTVLGLPFTDDATPAAILVGDPPRLPLYQGILLVFAGWGFAISLRRIARPTHLLLVATLVMTTLPILFTTRVDSHRLMMATVPLVLLAALGLREAIRVARSCGLPPALLHGCGGILVILAAASTSSLLYYSSPPTRPLIDAIEDRIGQTAEGPVQIITDMDHRDLGPIRLRLIERWRRNRSRDFTILADDEGRSFSDRFQPSAETFSGLNSLINAGPVMLAPAERYREAARWLEGGGFRVEEQGPWGGRYWLVSSRGTAGL